MEFEILIMVFFSLILYLINFFLKKKKILIDNIKHYEDHKKLLSLKNPPTAIICSLDKFFIGCLQECQKKGLNVPNDISVVGYNDHDNYLSSQNLTFISHPLTKMGKMAVEILEKIEKGENPNNLSKLIEPILNKGKSDGKIT